MVRSNLMFWWMLVVLHIGAVKMASSWSSTGLPSAGALAASIAANTPTLVVRTAP